ncbi:hypothetical protein PSHT_13492 [Puccinia striiformis]|uniref:Uncharacterized protein n=1 Tax=Puccinia striiformis TaxID=27350 RepID=A0A2S4UQI8_9BASI|nr:hypothetical protein PSHT_13492 [Puccinia striiformis]
MAPPIRFKVSLCLVLHALGGSQLASSSPLNSEVHPVENFNPFLHYDQGKSSDKIVFETPIKPAKQVKSPQNEGYEYRNIPQGLAERKDEMEFIFKDRNAIESGIQGLKTKSEGQSSRMISQLERLYRAFNLPTVNRLRRTGGLDRSQHSFAPEPIKLGTTNNPLKPAGTQVTNGGPLAEHGSGSKKMSKGSNFFGYDIDWRSLYPYSAASDSGTGNTLASLSEPLLKNSNSLELTPRISTEETPLKYEPLRLAQVQKPRQTTLTVLDAHLAERRIPRGDLKIQDIVHSLLGRQPDGDEYVIGDGLTIPQKIASWNSLQEQVFKFSLQSQETVSDAKEVEFQLEFLKSFCLLGDHIVRYGLLPSTEGIESLKPKSTIQMVELQTELLFRKLGANFYEDQASVIPEIEFWESARAVKHFHRSVKALPTEYHEEVVHAVLRTILSHTPDDLRFKAVRNKRFEKLRDEFLRPQFLQEARRLSSALISNHQPSINELEKADHLRVVKFVEDLMYFFEEPSMKTPPKQRRIEFQLVYYMIDYLQKFCDPVIGTIAKRTEDQKPIARREKKVYLFQDQLNFMRVYLRKFRDTSQDPDYTGNLSWEAMVPFKAILKGHGGNFDLFSRWINTYTAVLFEHCTWLVVGHSPLVTFDLWMGRRMHGSEDYDVSKFVHF